MTRRIRFIHWNAEEAKEKGEWLSAQGFAVEWEVPNGPDFFRKLNANPPDVVVIDLSRLPSQGRDAALAIRQYKVMRFMPIVFVGGDPEKVDRIRSLVHEAEYTDWENLLPSIDRSAANPPKNPSAPLSRLAGYAGVPLAKKLGIRSNTAVLLIDPPRGFRKTIDGLPEGTAIRKGWSKNPDVVLWFVRAKADLITRIKKMATSLSGGRLWIIWPKKTPGGRSDLTQNIVRETGLAAGLVDYKICSINSEWSGLLFARRRPIKK